jgi:hypothetical protein
MGNLKYVLEDEVTCKILFIRTEIQACLLFMLFVWMNQKTVG